MAKTSINLKPCKVTYSEAHNKREVKLDYVQPELSDKNEFWSSVESLPKRYKEIADFVKEKTGRKMQEKAQPLYEGLVVINQDTTMEQLHEIARRFKEKFGYQAVQISIHRDEGHFEQEENSDRQVWQPNFHAHIVFDRCNYSTGKTLKPKKCDTAEMQTIVAEVLGMERGQSSDKKHLSPEQYKAVQEAKKEAIKESLDRCIDVVKQLTTNGENTKDQLIQEGQEKKSELISEGEAKKNELIADGEKKNQVGEKYKEMNKNLYLENKDALTNAAEYRKAAKEASWRERMIAKFVSFGVFFKDKWDALFQGYRVESNALIIGGKVCNTDHTFDVYKTNFDGVEIQSRFNREVSTEDGLENGLKRGMTLGLWNDGSTRHMAAFNAYHQTNGQGLSR